MVRQALRPAGRFAALALATAFVTAAPLAAHATGEEPVTRVGTEICVLFTVELEEGDELEETSDCIYTSPSPVPGPVEPAFATGIVTLSRAPVAQPLADPPRVGTFSGPVYINSAPNTAPLLDANGRYNNWIYVSGLELTNADSSNFTPGYYFQGQPVTVTLYKNRFLRRPRAIGTVSIVFSYDSITRKVYVGKWPPFGR
jgi:hypothetical protein